MISFEKSERTSTSSYKKTKLLLSYHPWERNTQQGRGVEKIVFLWDESKGRETLEWDSEVSI